MEMTKHRVWMWARGGIALLLAVVLGGACIAHNGFRVGNASSVFAYMLISLGCIYVSIWRRWDFEIVGWFLLAVFFVGLAMS